MHVKKAIEILCCDNEIMSEVKFRKDNDDDGERLHNEIKKSAIFFFVSFYYTNLIVSMYVCVSWTFYNQFYHP